jgi:hypothetical protein
MTNSIATERKQLPKKLLIPFLIIDLTLLKEGITEIKVKVYEILYL